MSRHPDLKSANDAIAFDSHSEVDELLADLRRVLNDPAVIDARIRREIEARVDMARRHRRQRHDYFEEELFGEPCWDMLLELFDAELKQVRATIGSLAAAAGVPATTNLRQLKRLIDYGWAVREPDPRDFRRVIVRITPKGCDRMIAYFGSITL